MTDADRQPEAQLDPAPDAEDQAVHERELDEMLARAAGLAQELGEAAAAEEGDAASAGVTKEPARDMESGAVATVEAELAQLGELLEQNAAQLDAPDDAAPGGVSPQSGVGPESHARGAESKPKDDAIPDFMKEFMAEESAAGAGSTESRPLPPAGPQPGAKAASAQSTATIPEPKPPPRTSVTTSRPGVVGTGMLGVVRSSELDHPATVRTSGKGARFTKLLRPASYVRSKLPRFRGPLRRTPKLPASLKWLAPAVMAVCSRGVTVLEWIDRPLQNSRPHVRKIVGWVAVATLTTALLVHLVSFF